MNFIHKNIFLITLFLFSCLNASADAAKPATISDLEFSEQKIRKVEPENNTLPWEPGYLRDDIRQFLSIDVSAKKRKKLQHDQMTAIKRFVFSKVPLLENQNIESLLDAAMATDSFWKQIETFQKRIMQEPTCEVHAAEIKWDGKKLAQIKYDTWREMNKSKFPAFDPSKIGGKCKPTPKSFSTTCVLSIPAPDSLITDAKTGLLNKQVSICSYSPSSDSNSVLNKVFPRKNWISIKTTQETITIPAKSENPQDLGSRQKEFFENELVQYRIKFTQTRPFEDTPNPIVINGVNTNPTEFKMTSSEIIAEWTPKRESDKADTSIFSLKDKCGSVLFSKWTKIFDFNFEACNLSDPAKLHLGRSGRFYSKQATSKTYYLSNSTNLGPSDEYIDIILKRSDKDQLPEITKNLFSKMNVSTECSETVCDE